MNKNNITEPTNQDETKRIGKKTIIRLAQFWLQKISQSPIGDTTNLMETDLDLVKKIIEQTPKVLPGN